MSETGLVIIRIAPTRIRVGSCTSVSLGQGAQAGKSGVLLQHRLHGLDPTPTLSPCLLSLPSSTSHHSRLCPQALQALLLMPVFPPPSISHGVLGRIMSFPPSSLPPASCQSYPRALSAYLSSPTFLPYFLLYLNSSALLCGFTLPCFAHAVNSA